MNGSKRQKTRDRDWERERENWAYYASIIIRAGRIKIEIAFHVCINFLSWFPFASLQHAFSYFHFADLCNAILFALINTMSIFSVRHTYFVWARCTYWKTDLMKDGTVKLLRVISFAMCKMSIADLKTYTKQLF